MRTTSCQSKHFHSDERFLMKVSALLLLLTTNFMVEEVMLELVRQVASEAEVRRALAFILLRMETSPITTGSGKKRFQQKTCTPHLALAHLRALLLLYDPTGETH